MIATPKGYEWLSKVGTLPKTISLALKELGVKEIVGKGSNKTIIGWRDELNGATTNGKAIVSGYSDDDIPWCGLFAAVITYRRMKKILEVVKEPLWARNWAKYGAKTTTPGLGDILVFSRGSGGHVGFYVGEDSTAYHVIGGNQGNRVSVTRVLKNRLLAARRPPYNSQPKSVKAYRVAASGGISKDEA